MSCALIVAASFLLLDRSSRAGERRLGPRLGCVSCLLVADDGRVLWSRRPDLRLPNASTTKMVVALVTQAADPEPMVLVSAEAAATGGGGPQLRAGDRLPVSKLLAGLLMASSNDAAVALAEHVAGSSERFVAMMNRLARSLGATGTHFVNPHGLDEPGHHSTAHDLALFGEELLDTPALARIVARRSLKVATTEGVQRFENTNLLLETYPGAVGVKTGYTIAAGNVLVAAAERGGRRLVSVVMNSADAFRDSSTLLDRGWRLLRRGVLLARGDPVASVVFDPGGATTAVAGATVRGPNDPASVVVSFIGRPAGAPAPAPGDRVGTVRVVDDKGRIVATVPALAEGRVDEATGDSPAARLLGDILALGAKLIPVAP